MEFCGLVHFGSVSHMGYLSQRDTLLALVNVSPELYWSIGTPPTPTPHPPVKQITSIYYKTIVYKVEESINISFLGKGNE